VHRKYLTLINILVEQYPVRNLSLKREIGDFLI
jgi:hypothetical protein